VREREREREGIYSPKSIKIVERTYGDGEGKISTLSLTSK